MEEERRGVLRKIEPKIPIAHHPSTFILYPFIITMKDVLYN